MQEYERTEQFKKTKVKVLFSRNQKIISREPKEMSINDLVDYARKQLIKTVAKMIILGKDKDEIIYKVGAQEYTAEEKEELFREAMNLIKKCH